MARSLHLSLALLLLGATAPLRAALPAPDPDDGAITLPAGFRALVVADDLGRGRFLAVASNGDVYLKLLNGGIVALRDTTGDGRADVRETFGGGGGTGIAIHDGWLYHSTNSAVLRYRMEPGQLVPRGEPEVVVTDLPDRRTHAAKVFAFDGSGRLYVEVGSPTNAYGNPDRQRGAVGQDPTEHFRQFGGFWRFDAHRLGQRQSDGFHFSTGHRHVLTIAWNRQSERFFVVQHGRDQLNTVAPQYYTAEANAELPAEELHELREGGSFGWPFTYWDPIAGVRRVAPEYGGDGQKIDDSGKYPDPLVALPAHWAPMQMAFYEGTQFPARYRGGAFIAFHGSWNRAPMPQKGYNVTFVPFGPDGWPTGTYEVFANGFSGREEIANPGQARFRPNGLAVGPDGSLYVGDSQRGRVWRIFYTGETSTAAP